ncbi:MAG: glycosyl hydrolase, partial [Planctomycetota bacterium]
SFIAATVARADMREDFVDPPASYHTRPLWFWNGPLSTSETSRMMDRSLESGYSGFGILPAQGMTPEFMSPEFLERYQEAVDKAAQLGMKMCLYDEYWFPSGSAGGQLAKQYPEALSKRLDMLAVDIEGPKPLQQPLPPGLFMGAVAMNADTRERVNLAGHVGDGKLTWDVPAGPWKIMLFTCVTDGARGLVDYLDPESVRKFVSLTYQKYYQKFPEHFGKTIDSAFFDEPTFHWVEGGRAWTGAFNREFEKRRGFDPVPYYPALWFDIGPETAAARNALFGVRAELYAEGFTKTLQDWCREHGIELTGHQDQEEIVNPVGLCGDLIKCFEHQDIPGIDQIFQYGRASKAYKVVSSAAYNYDRRLVMTECYGGIKDMPVENLYKEAMDQFAKGINVMVPHAVWYDSANVIFPPELSYKSAVYGPALPDYNKYVARLQRILQHGRHVANVAVLYPIATLQAGYYFGVGTPYTGGVVPPEADYMDVGEMLALEVRRDYTFLHPEVLDQRCSVDGPTLRLDNKVNHEEYRVFVLPGSKTIHWSSLRKIKQFYDQGGTVVATTQLPEHSAEFGQDPQVRDAIAAMFGPQKARSDAGNSEQEGGRQGPQHTVRTNANGGKAYFLPNPTPAGLKAVLDEALPVCDVAFEQDVAVSGGNLSYIHKVVEGRNVFFFANSSQTSVDCHVRIRGKLRLEQWNPHTGEIDAAESAHLAVAGEEVTRVRLTLPPVESRFLVSSGDEPVSPVAFIGKHFQQANERRAGSR